MQDHTVTPWLICLVLIIAETTQGPSTWLRVRTGRTWREGFGITALQPMKDFNQIDTDRIVTSKGISSEMICTLIRRTHYDAQVLVQRRNAVG